VNDEPAIGLPDAPLERQPRRALLLAIGAVLVLVLLAVGYVQWRQYKLLDATSRFQNDALGWSFAQLETEQLRLRNELQLYASDPQHRSADKVQLRYDIFVSRAGLVDQERAAGIMRDQVAYASAIAQVRAFVKFADRYLGETPTHALDGAAGGELLAMLDALNVPLHDLSLGASHLLYQQATERNDAVRQQSVLGIALTVFQCLLLLVLAIIVLRQLNALTERRRNLEALAETLSAARRGAEGASRAKSAFLANMSHEIRTPFHGMLGMMSLLQEGGLSPQQATYLDTARDSAHHLLTILNDILDLSQLESGKLQVVPQTVDLPQLVTQVDALMRPQAHQKGLVLEVDVDPDVPRWVSADPTRLKQILFNLMSNALKFTDRGTIVLRVSTAASGRLDFSVSDSGIGMDEATISRLFQRFMQGDETPSRRASGAGLGLEISRDLARLMNGDITARGRVGVGSTFVASLPLAAVSAPAPTSADKASPEAGSFKRLRVLVAEDHPVNRAYLEAVLDRLGHVAVFTLDGDSAVRALQAQPAEQGFDIVLMDLHMPGMDGFSAARTIRAMPAPRGRVPIVALTADAFQASRELARDAGMDGFLTKPAHLPQLREALERYSAGQAASDPRPSAGTPPQGSLLDPATVADAKDALSAPRYAKLLGDFLQERTLLVAQLRRAAIGSTEELRARAHSLKGASSSLGLRAVGEAAAKLQAIASDMCASDTLTGVEITVPSFTASVFDAPPGAQPQTSAMIDRIEALLDASHEECRRSGLLGPPAPITPPEVRAPT
jgi:signal transduction histidine kinase/DNA-binding NarL/FixJ family response regulator